MTEVEESGHHDLCFLGEPCSHEVPEHGFCSRQFTMCIHCERECICERLQQAENYARIAVMHTVDVDSCEQGQRDCEATPPVLALKEITRIASKGYDTGLDAAREAVEGEWTEDPSWDGTNWNNALTSALSAINAPKEER